MPTVRLTLLATSPLLLPHALESDPRRDRGRFLPLWTARGPPLQAPLKHRKSSNVVQSPTLKPAKLMSP